MACVCVCVCACDFVKCQVCDGICDGVCVCVRVIVNVCVCVCMCVYALEDENAIQRGISPFIRMQATVYLYEYTT